MSQADQKIMPLEGEEAAHVERQRDWVRDHFVLEAQHKYQELDEKLRLLQTILDEKWIEPAETWKLQSLGITFGDALAQKLDLIWVTVEDEVGRDPALMVPGTSILLWPLTVISKRIEGGEPVNVRDLFDRFCERVPVLRNQDTSRN